LKRAVICTFAKLKLLTNVSQLPSQVVSYDYARRGVFTRVLKLPERKARTGRAYHAVDPTLCYPFSGPFYIKRKTNNLIYLKC